MTLFSQLSFAAGEISKLLWARRDLAKRRVAVERAVNMVVLPEGGLTRRSGTRFVRELKFESAPGELIPFRFSKSDAYMLVVNGGEMQVFRNGGIVETSPGTPYFRPLPYTDADLPNLRWQQSLDSLFLTCRGVPPLILKRLGHANWDLQNYVAAEGALEPQNVDPAKAIQSTGISGAVTLSTNFAAFDAASVGTVWRIDEADLSSIPLWTANETVPVNNLRRWQGRVYENVTGNLDCGSNPPTHTEGTILSAAGKVAWAFRHPGYGYVQIGAYISPTSATGTVVGEIPISAVTGPTTRFYAPAWSATLGWPEHAATLDNRLIFARRDTFWMTRPGDYYSFELDATDASALIGRLTPVDGQLPDIEWLLPSGIIVVGCTGSEWLIRGPSPFDALKLDNIRPVHDKSEGSAPHRPCAVDGGVVFIGNSRRELHFAAFDRVAETLAIELTTKFARHMLRGKAMHLAWQRAPNRILWVACADGSLVSLTFRPSEETVGWTRHDLGGFVENIAVIPGQERADDELWLIVRRTVNGAQRRYLEVLQPFFEPRDEAAPTASGAWFVDCGLPFGTEKPITAFTRSNPGIFTCPAHGFSDGDEVEAESTTSPSGHNLRGRYTVRTPGSDVVRLEQNGVLIDTTGWAAFAIAGTLSAPAQTLSGLGHLEGREVAIFADGAVQPRRTVTGGAITLQEPAGRGVVGLPMPWSVKPLPYELEGERGSTLGSPKQAKRAIVETVDSLGGKARANGGAWERLDLAAPPSLGVPPLLFTGPRDVTLGSPSETLLTVELAGDDPLPFTFTGLSPDISAGR